MPKPLVWIAGDAAHRDFASVRKWLDEHAQAVSAADDAGFPRAIVFFQSRPGQISQVEIERLHRRAPLARLIAIVGPLCEGQPRADKTWQGVTRMYWHQAVARLPAEIGFGSATNSNNVGQPQKLTEAELLKRQLGPALRRNPHRGSVAICTARRSDFQALADACTIAGWLSAWNAPGRLPKSAKASVYLVDGWESLPAGNITPPTLLLLNFPRPDDLDRAASLGIQQVLAWPFLLPDMLAALDSLSRAANARHAGVA